MGVWDVTGGLSRTARIVVTDRQYADSENVSGRYSRGFPGHPGTYEVTEPGEVGEVLEVAAASVAELDGGGGFVCMCQGEFTFALYDAADRCIRTVDRHGPLPLLDPADPASLPGRHRAAWATRAPEPLRRYAQEWARGDRTATGAVTSSDGDLSTLAPLTTVLSWLGTPPSGIDAARRLARLAPLALLDGATTGALERAVRRSDRAGLDGAVEFFASEHFTARHPKRRRVGATTRDLLIRHANAHRPQHVAVLERRLLRAAEDRVVS
ncbi:hypothetical protein [Streptomyces ficellus]|uniref:hypothetical protein n=1 Tax=Streptomyces ficellus TaxID=1977088 RepID=UPI0012E96A73|nr:hypothetical protein [Streptomyces ficellus]